MRKKLALNIWQQQFVKDNYMSLGMATMAKRLEVPIYPVRNYMNAQNLIVPDEIKKTFKGKGNIGRTNYTLQEDETIRTNYLTMPIKQLATMMNRSFTGINGRLSAMGLEVPVELAAQRKAEGMYRQGSVPKNKGKKQSEYMTPEAIARTALTRFCKGHIPHNHHEEIGTIVIRHAHKDRKAPPYKWIKTLEGMRMLHAYNWEQIHGKVPKGFVLRFKDGNTMYCDPINLELITLIENMKRNTIHRYPDELKELIRLNAKLKKIRKKITI